MLLLETWKYFSFLYLDSRSVNINITKIFIFMWIPTCGVEIDICIRTSSLSTSIPHCGWIRLISLHNAIPDFSKKFNSSTSCKLEDFRFLLLSSSLSSIIYHLKINNNIFCLIIQDTDKIHVLIAISLSLSRKNLSFILSSGNRSTIVSSNSFSLWSTSSSVRISFLK